MIEYKKVKRKVSVGSNPGEKFYADIVRGQTVELDEIYKDMTDLTSLSRGDAMNAIDTLTQLFSKYFRSGRNVNLRGCLNLISRILDGCHALVLKF